MPPVWTGGLSSREVKSCCLPVDLEADITLDGIAVGEMIERRVERAFAVERIFVVGPGVGATGTDATPSAIIIGEQRKIERQRRCSLPQDGSDRPAIMPNILNRQFAADRPKQKWVADFTNL